MNRLYSLSSLLISGSLALYACGSAPRDEVSQSVAALSTQSVGVAAYFSDWSAMLTRAPPTRLIIMPGPITGYTTQITNAHNAGAKVLGYVFTSYGARAPGAVTADIDTLYSLYPNIDGIFFDEAQVTCPVETSYYQPLYTYVKGKSSSALVVQNPGSAANVCYLSYSDIVVTFESSYDNYVNHWDGTNPDRAWETAANSGRIWHMIHTAPTLANTTNALSLSQSRQAGYVYVTQMDANMGTNTYGSLAQFYNQEADAVTSFNSGGGGGAPISSYSASNTASTASYTATFANAWSWKHVFIDTDLDPATGYTIGGIGANYMIENDTLYSMGNGAWSPTPLGAVTRTGAGGGAAGTTTWTVSRSTIGETATSGEQSKLIFDGDGAFTEYSTPVYAEVFTP